MKSEAVLEGVDVETKLGTVKNIPAGLLGWIMIGCLAAFMVYKMTGNFETKLDALVHQGQQQTIVLEKILDQLRK